MTIAELPRQSRIYVAGPMTGRPGWNFAEFERATLLLEAHGMIVASPHRVDGVVWGFRGEDELAPGMSHRSVLPIDLAILLTCDAIYLLPGWGASKGARAERALADALGLKVLYAAGAERGELGLVS